MKNLTHRLASAALALALASCSGNDDNNNNGGPAVTGVTLAPASLSMTVGDAPRTLVASIEPSDAAEKGVTWASGNASVATVTGTGLSVTVGAVGAGSTTITVTTKDGGKTATCEVTVALATVSGVSLDKQGLTLMVGGSGPLTATIAPANAANKDVTWTSGNPAVAGINGDGLSVTVNALAAGSSVITVKTADGGHTADCAVVVTTTPLVTVAKVSLPKAITIRANGKQGHIQADVEPYNASNKSLTWSSSQPAFATVGANGLWAGVTGLAPGATRVTATATENPSISDYCDVTVAESVWHDVHVGGEYYGMFKNGELDETYDGNMIWGMAMASDGIMHACGQYWDDHDSMYRATYYRNGVKSYLPTSGSAGIFEAGAECVHIANDGHVYIAGFEANQDGWTAKLWKDGVNVPLGGVGGYFITEATGVCVSGGNVYVAGVMSLEGYRPDAALLWVNGELTVFDDQPILKNIPRCIAAAGNDVYIGGPWGLMKTGPSNPKAYQLLAGYENPGPVNWGLNIYAVKIAGGDVYAAGWVENDPVVWKNHARTVYDWDKSLYYAEAKDMVIGQDGSVYVAGNEMEQVWDWEIPRPVLWKNGVRQDVPDTIYDYTRAVAIRETPGRAVASVTLSETTLNIPLRYTGTLTATVLPADASYQTVEWTSDNPAVASITGRGLAVTINGLAIGGATIRATSPDGPQGVCAVNVINVPVEGVDLPDSADTGIGRSIRLDAVIIPATATNQGIAWASSDHDVATVTGTGPVGTVVAIGVGSAVIQARTADGDHTATCTVNVKTLADLNAPTIYIAGAFGLYANGRYDQAVGVRDLYGVFVDDAENTHAAGVYGDRRAAYYRNGVPFELPWNFDSVNEVSANDLDVAPNGDVYIAGMEMHDGCRGARLWKAAPDGAVTKLPLPGIIETNFGYSYAEAVRVHGGAVYVAGGAEGDSWDNHPVIWKDQVKYQVGYQNPDFNFKKLLDLGFGSGGVIYVLGDNNTVYRVAQDLSTMTVVFQDRAVSGIMNRMSVDGDDIYVVGNGQAEDGNAYYWKNGTRYTLEAPTGALWARADAVFAVNGHAYMVGCCWQQGPSGYRNLLWIDGMPVHDDRSIEDWFPSPAYSQDTVMPHAVFAKVVAHTPVASLTLNSNAADIPVGYTMDLTATLLPADATNKTVIWTSSDPAVASIAGAGQTATVNGLALGGPVTIRATSLDGPTATCVVNVTEVLVTDVSLPATFTVGRTRQVRLRATVTPETASNKNIAWTSSNQSVATVSGTGPVATLLGVAFGETTITAVTEDGGHTAHCLVTVAEPTEPAIHIAGEFGLYTDGYYNTAIGDQALFDVYADTAGNVYAAGYYHDTAAAFPWRAALYKNGAPTILEMTHGAADIETGAMGVTAAGNGDVYVCGYEYFNGDSGYEGIVARLWKGDGSQVYLGGIDETGFARCYANAVLLHNDDNDVYVMGYDDSINFRWSVTPAVWKNGEQHLYGAMPDYTIADFGFNPDGSITALCYNEYYWYQGWDPGPYTVRTLQPDLTTWAKLSIDHGDLTWVMLNDLFVDGWDYHLVGYIDNDAYYWKNGEAVILDAPAGAYWVEADAVHVLDGHTYIAGLATFDVEETYYQIVQWVDGALVTGDSMIADKFYDAYRNVEVKAIFAQR